MVIFAAHVSLPALGSEMDRFLPKAGKSVLLGVM